METGPTTLLWFLRGDEGNANAAYLLQIKQLVARCASPVVQERVSHLASHVQSGAEGGGARQAKGVAWNAPAITSPSRGASSAQVGWQGVGASTSAPQPP